MPIWGWVMCGSRFDRRSWLIGLGMLLVGLVILAGGKQADADQSESLTRSFQAGTLAAGNAHTCALLDNGAVRCWGDGGSGRLGYANTNSIGDNETPGSVGPVSLGGTLVANVADLAESASSSDTRVDVGGSFTVRFDVQNFGPDTAAGVASQITLPGGATVTSSLPSRGNFNPGTGVWSVGALPSGQAASLRLQLTANAVGSLDFESEAGSLVFDPVSLNDGSEVDVISGSVTGPTGPSVTGPSGPSVTGPSGPSGPVGPSRLAVALTSKKLTGKAKKNLKLAYAATESATVTAKVLKGKKVQTKATGKAKQGANTLKIKLPKKPGSYKLELSAKAGAVTAKAVAKLTVKR